MKLSGLNVRSPWARLIAEGLKTVETRFYMLPRNYVGVPVAIVETPGPGAHFSSRVVAIVLFGESYQYENSAHFYLESDKHLIRRETSEFNWKNGKRKWAWPIVKCKPVALSLPPGLKRGIVFTKSIEFDPRGV